MFRDFAFDERINSKPLWELVLYRLSEGMFYSLKFSLFSRIFRGFAEFCENFEQNQDCAISRTIQNNIDVQNKKNAPFSVRSCIWWKVVDSNHRSHRRQIYSLEQTHVFIDDFGVVPLIFPYLMLAKNKMRRP